MKKTIGQLKLKGKKVIIRVDFNVPMKDGVITSDTRIKAALPTIKKAIKEGAKVILLSHLGRIKELSDCAKYDLEPVAQDLANKLGKSVTFVRVPTGQDVIDTVSKMKNGHVVMLQNTRWEDINKKAESKNDPALGKFWASLGDVFINDAFGTSHRAHASNVGIAQNISETAIGYLVNKEVEALTKVTESPEHPAVAIIGGAKVSDKIKTIDNLVKNVDKVLIGGGMMFTFWKALGYNIGNSLVELDQVKLARTYLDSYASKIIIASDALISNKFENTVPFVSSEFNIQDGMMGLDVGPKTIKNFKKELKNAKTVIWNGPLGVTEFDNYAKGTLEIAEAIGSLKDAYTVVGGGDSVAAINKLNLAKKFSHISTGGGASLEMLEGKKLPGIEVIADKK